MILLFFRYICGIIFFSTYFHGFVYAQKQNVIKNVSIKDKLPQTLKGYDKDGGQNKILFILPIQKEIDLGLAAFVERKLVKLTKDHIVILHIKTFGGRVDAAVRIRDAILKTKATTIAYVDHRAISAGALISLASDTIIMRQGSSIGAATPIQGGGDKKAKPVSEKVVSYMRTEMRATAESKNRRTDIAEAMVDADIEIKGIIPKGKLLTMTSDEAMKINFIDGIIKDLDSIITLLNLTKAQRFDIETDWAEKLARILTNSTISSLLMSFGFIGVLMELYSPGFGIGGIIGSIFLGLFFLGQYASHLSGWEEILIFMISALLIFAELFIIPGFGIAGILGIIGMITALFMGLLELDIPFEIFYDLGYFSDVVEILLQHLAVTSVFIVIAFIIFTKYFSYLPFSNKIIFQTSSHQDNIASLLPEELVSIEIGSIGITQSILRPIGVASFDNKRKHVITEGEFISDKEKVKVIEVKNNRIVVEKFEEPIN